MDCVAEICQALTTKAEKLSFDTSGARRFVVDYLKKYGATSSEKIVLEARDFGFQPHDERAWGGVFGVLSRNDEIVCLRADLPRRRGHGTSGGKLWRAA
jgi:hypothetical protein